MNDNNQIRKISAQPHINYTCITVILTLLHKEQVHVIEFESQNVYIVNIWGCEEIKPDHLI